MFGVRILLLTVLFTGSSYGAIALRLDLVVQGLAKPVFVTHSGDGSGRLFVVQQAGIIRIVKNGQLLPGAFLDIRNRVISGGERGLLGLAFHPNFSQNGRFFVNYTRQLTNLETVIAEYRVNPPGADTAQVEEKILLTYTQPFANHNAGMIAFGPDGYLYIASGDGGSGGDPQGNGQKLQTLLGKVLRIDVNAGGSAPYGIPSDNPFASGVQGRPEIWAYGFRNPWRFSFDRRTGRLFLADVGQKHWEEVDRVIRGGNYGWNRMEGNHCFPPTVTECNQSGLIRPIAEYSHSEGASVTGGYVYRGSQRAGAVGRYFFADYSSGRIWWLIERANGKFKRQLMLDTDLKISSFGEDQKGELYLLDHAAGKLYFIRLLKAVKFAQAGDGSTAMGSLQTSVLLTNPEDVPVRAEVIFRGQDGGPMAVTIGGTTADRFVVDIAAGSSAALTTDGVTSGLQVGWIEVEADGMIEGAVVFSLKDAQGRLVSEAGISSTEPAGEFAAPIVRDTRIGLGAGLAIANPSASEPAQVTVEVLDQSGASLGVHEFLLAPGEQSARFIHEMIALPEVFQGTLVIRSDADIVPTLLRTLHGVHSASLPMAEVPPPF